MSDNTVLVTGAAGFIGYHVVRRLLADGWEVVGVDNLNAYYDPRLKEARLAQIPKTANFTFEKCDLVDQKTTAALFANHKFPYVVHLAAQPGIPHSIVDPQSYVSSNVTGFMNVLEGCRHVASKHLIYASSSSVYGANSQIPYTTSENVDHPLNIYGATKKANELMAHAYAHLFALPATGLRFFTVYGPWGRPDMAMWLFTEAILEGRPIQLFNRGSMRRDFTYVDDVSEPIARLVRRPATPEPTWTSDAPNPAASLAPWRIYNIGNNQTVSVTRLVAVIENALGKKAVCEAKPMRPGDMLETYADSTDLERAVGFRPDTPLEEGVKIFVEWYHEYQTMRRSEQRTPW